MRFSTPAWMAVFAACGLGISTACAEDTQSLFDSHFAKVADGAPCYARTYDDTHLAAHPKQTVKRIEFAMNKSNPSGNANTAANFELGFGVQVTKSPEWYTGLAICKDTGGAIDCFLEGDGGRFRLTAANKDGALKLETGDYGLAFEGANDGLEISGTEGDDKVFVLTPRAHAACEAAAFDVKQTHE